MSDQDVKTTSIYIDTIERKQASSGVYYLVTSGQVQYSVWVGQGNVEEALAASLKPGDWITLGYTERQSIDGQRTFRNVTYITTGGTPPAPQQPRPSSAPNQPIYSPNGDRLGAAVDPRQHSIERQVVLKGAVELYPTLLQYSIIDPEEPADGQMPAYDLFLTHIETISNDLYAILQRVGAAPPADPVTVAAEVEKLKNYANQKGWSRSFVLSSLKATSVEEWFMSDGTRTFDEAAGILDIEDDLPW